MILEGTLGAGKTVLAKGIARSLGVTETVTSPTYTIVSEYEGRLRLLHVDLYRIHDDDEYLQLGLDDEFTSQTVALIEWPERARAALPEDALPIRITIENEASRSFDLPNGLAGMSAG